MTLLAACTPNSLPDAAGNVEHGFQINVLTAYLWALYRTMGATGPAVGIVILLLSILVGLQIGRTGR